MDFSKLFRHCPVCGGGFTQHNVKSMCCTACGFVYYINPSAATAAFIQNEKGELLVCRRAKEPAKGTLDLPGGFVDGNETGEEAIAREVQEETGGIVTESTYLFSLPNLYEYSGLTIPTLDMFFACRLADDRYLHADDDVAACRFVPLDEIDPQQFGLQSIRRAVERFLKQKR